VYLTATTIGTSLASDLALVVLEQVGVRLGVSGGILAAGAESSWATLGVGLAVGLVVDQVVGAVWIGVSIRKGSCKSCWIGSLHGSSRCSSTAKARRRSRAKLQSLNQGRAALRGRRRPATDCRTE